MSWVPSIFSLNTFSFFFFNDTATTVIYTLSLHDALPILDLVPRHRLLARHEPHEPLHHQVERSEEHTSELQSHVNLVCRLLLEKKKKNLPRSCTAWRRWTAKPCAVRSCVAAKPRRCSFSTCFFFNDTATTEIYTLSLHDALPISPPPGRSSIACTTVPTGMLRSGSALPGLMSARSEEHTSELQSHVNLVCRL